MPYGTVKVDNVTFTNNSVDAATTFSGIYASITNNLTLSGTATAATFTGTTANFTNVNAQNISVTTSLSGLAITGGTAGFTTITGTTVTGTTANFVSGVFTTQVSGVTVTGTTANFASGVFTTQVSGAIVVATTIELGNASDTTLSRSAAGVLAVEGVVIPSISSTSTLTNKTLTDPAIIGTILEDVFTITDAAAFEVDPGNGSIQLITLGANRTPKCTNFVAGESVTLMVNDGTAYTMTWTDATWGTGGVIWKGGIAPTLATTGFSVIQFWKVSTQVYGASVGDVA